MIWDTLTVVTLFLSLHSLGLALALLRVNRAHVIANRLLAVGLLLVVFVVIDNWLWVRPDIAKAVYHLQWFPLIHGVTFALWPLLYLYAVALVTPQFRISWQHKWHFIPVVFITLLFWSLFAIQPVTYAQFDAFLQGEGSKSASMDTCWACWFFIIMAVLQGIQTFGYVYLFYQFFKQHRRRVYDYYSSLGWVYLRWLQILIVLLAINVLGYVLFVGMFFNEGQGFSFEAYSGYEIVFFALLVSALGYFGLWQPAFFAGLPQAEEAGSVPSSTSSKEKYQRSNLSEQEIMFYRQNLLDYMQTAKPYLKSDLTLPQLAEMVGVRSAYHLSQLLNEHLGQNFYDFVNSYRVAAAKQSLLAAKERRILDIAMSAGFSSQSAFYDVFKRTTGLTPSQYKKQ